MVTSLVIHNGRNYLKQVAPSESGKYVITCRGWGILYRPH